MSGIPVSTRIALQLPSVSAALRGSLYTAAGTGRMELSLMLDPANLGGTVQYGDRAPLTLLDPTLEVLMLQEAGPIPHARYRLRYSVYFCEDAKPVEPGTPMIRWDPCYYVEGDPVPVQLEETDMLLARERTPRGEAFTAAGICDFSNLSVFRASGSAR